MLINTFIQSRLYNGLHILLIILRRRLEKLVACYLRILKQKIKKKPYLEIYKIESLYMKL